MKDFNSTQLEPAKKLFELWLEQYDLPKTEIKREHGTVTLKDMAMEHFVRRVRDLEQRIAEDPTVKEPLLSQEYIESFLQFINENGTTLMLLEMQNEVKADETARMTANSGGIFDDETAKKNQDSQNLIAAIVVNKSGLNTLLDKNMEIVEKEMRAETPSVESLQRWRQNVKERFAKHMSNMNAFKVSCDSRVRQMRQLDELVAKSQAFLLNALGERFAGENLMTSSKLSEKTRTGGSEGGVPVFLGVLMNNFASQVEQKAEAFRRLAHRTVNNPLGSQMIFTTDTEGNPALSNEFRDLARACVKAACETKDFRGLVKKIDKELGI